MRDENNYQSWLAKAKDDLRWTQASLKEEIYYGACFTAQQAVEKALKAYLFSQDKQPRKIHDLGALLEDCKDIDSDFEKLREATVTLTDYYVEVRYPDISDFMEYTQEQAEEALDLAQEAVKFVDRKIGYQSSSVLSSFTTSPSTVPSSAS